ncbi:MAG TPA: enolase C-terminal domain-like protein, partial [Acidimicrobiia bacterium]|nr:enolase C-terminal domain-like protein [Acidimicrobiia bacterium]
WSTCATAGSSTWCCAAWPPSTGTARADAVPRLHLHEVEVAFRRPLSTPDGTFATRRSVLVGYEENEITGWGEAAAFPSGRWGTADQAWSALASGDPAAVAAAPLASAALQAARRDHDARERRVPLCSTLGGAIRPVRARLSTGLADDPDALVGAVKALVDSGAAAVKVKIRPGRDLEPIAALRAAFSELAISVDANGGYTDPDDPVFPALDALGVDLIEQPLSPGDLAGCARLRDRIAAAVCLDEEVRNPDDATRVLAAAAADVLALKVMRLGYDAALEILTMCRHAAVGVKAGGTFDTAIGRHHVLAFATLDGVIDAEAGPPTGYLTDTLAGYPGFENGTITPLSEPGIGVDPHPEALATAVRSTVVEWAS